MTSPLSITLTHSSIIVAIQLVYMLCVRHKYVLLYIARCDGGVLRMFDASCHSHAQLYAWLAANLQSRLILIHRHPSASTFSIISYHYNTRSYQMSGCMYAIPLCAQTVRTHCTLLVVGDSNPYYAGGGGGYLSQGSPFGSGGGSPGGSARVSPAHS